MFQGPRTLGSRVRSGQHFWNGGPAGKGPHLSGSCQGVLRAFAQLPQVAPVQHGKDGHRGHHAQNESGQMRRHEKLENKSERCWSRRAASRSRRPGRACGARVGGRGGGPPVCTEPRELPHTTREGQLPEGGDPAPPPHAAHHEATPFDCKEYGAGAQGHCREDTR